jgi:hypothetical protein
LLVGLGIIATALNRYRDSIDAIFPEERVIKRVGRVIVHDLGLSYGAHSAARHVVF